MIQGFIRLRDFWRLHFLVLEPVMGLVVTALLGVYVHWVGMTHVFQHFHNRAAVYGALATISGSLLGFVIAAFSILVTVSESAKLTIVRGSKHYPTLWRVFTNAMRLLSVGTVTCLLAMALDEEQHPSQTAVFLAFSGTTLAFVGCGRCLWVFEQLIGILTKPSRTE
jgi:hypothetical protein